MKLIFLKNHDHWYYDTAAKINQVAWEFLKRYSLDTDSVYQKHNFN